jgi:formylmethanofuran dehydrogenase subunit C
MKGIVASPRAALQSRVDLAAVLAGSWTGLDARDLSRRPVRLEDGTSQPMGELFDLTGTPAGLITFQGDFTKVDRLGAGLAEGMVAVGGDVGDEVGLAMSGGFLDIHGSVGARAGGAAADARRGMTGGELLIRGDAGPEPGTRMRRGLLVVTGDVAGRAGSGMIAGTVIVFGQTGIAPGRWSKRGSIVVLGEATIPPTYRYACTYRPEHLRLTLLRLRHRHRVTVEERHVSGLYRRYSGDLADLGKGEILAWTAA